ncbi:hypothetical protein B9Z55_025094 [Caenorhabditis nigoni]|uniref:Uncharacterized protein n=1 Tax=Caenorhabditis nigoni TaxID=1611254 RepID=A0A2G5SX96_9PELO|nr:hypothetical protein B9Z55_025094 [Caenorhabditis nigoni]
MDASMFDLKHLELIFGTKTNFPEFQINKTRMNIQRLTLIRNTAVQCGATALYLNKLDRLIELNCTIIRLGGQPLCHADLVVMWQTVMEIRGIEALLEGFC